MMYIATLETNILGATGSLALAPHTYVVAPNGGGKTRITVALGLLLTGSADDLLGKEGSVRASGDLLTLAPYSEGKLNVAGSLVKANGDRESLHFRIDGSGGVARHPEESRPTFIGPWSFPVRDVGRALWEGPKAARDFFLRFLGDAIAPADILRKIPEEFRGPQQTNGRDPQTIDELRAFIADADQQARECASTVKAQEGLANEIGNGLPSDPTEQDLQAAEAALVNATRYANAVAHASAHVGTRQRLQAVQNEVQHYTAALAYADANPVAAPLSPNPMMETLAQMGSNLVPILQEWAKFNNPTCVTCGGPQSPAQLQGKIEELANLVHHVNNQFAGYRNAQGQWQQGQREIAQAREYVAKMAAEVQQLNHILAYADPNAAEAPAGAEQAAQAAVSQAQSARDALHDARARNAAVRTAKDMARQSGRLTSWWKEYAAVLRGVVAEIMDGGAARFRDRVQTYLPEEYRLVLVLKDGNRDIFRVGLERNGAVHLALSGAEKTVIEFALTAACLSLLPEAEKPSFAVLCPWEERAIDPENGTRLMRALSALPYQIVLYSIVPPAGKLPKGWALLDMSPPKRTRKKGAAKEGDDENDAVEGGDADAGTNPGDTAAAQAAAEAQATAERDQKRAAEEAEAQRLVSNVQAMFAELGQRDPGASIDALFTEARIARVDELGHAFGSPNYRTATIGLRELHRLTHAAVEAARAKVTAASAPATVETVAAPAVAAPAPAAAPVAKPPSFADLLAAVQTKMLNDNTTN